MDNVNTGFLSTMSVDGFVGTIYGMYTTSLGESSKNRASFNWFKIEIK
ncbi:hypothetical protein [Algibacter mikhailovii]|uniref:Beta-xylosidase C-terminal Concanavalin A-like domain-containing protein n=1 Tax=Algibacter mikhailovii TaxID=425498 RepID=A0A918QVY9_9FLAO|nr:hypothetical protein [Algibacter mikhailovii]GGZ75286.1 hypothetical protein GCM10007028_10990 [Algibacter mikhailovii]